jgi:3-oxoacyl-[acyl-carrier-protein] synthase-3
VLLEPSLSDELGIEDFVLHMDGEGGKYLFMEAGGSLLPATAETVEKKMHYLIQDGKPIFKAAVTGMSDVAQEILTRNNLNGDDVDLLIPHQANLRIIDSMANRLKLDPEKVVINIANYGNTTAGTIPIAMSEAYREGRLKKGDRVMFAAFGAGYIWGSVLLKWAME